MVVSEFLDDRKEVLEQGRQKVPVFFTIMLSFVLSWMVMAKIKNGDTDYSFIGGDNAIIDDGEYEIIDRGDAPSVVTVNKSCI